MTSLICCFQTLEHVPGPKTLTEEAFGLLRPGGILAFVTHDYTAPINRALGRRSPVDVGNLLTIARKPMLPAAGPC